MSALKAKAAELAEALDGVATVWTYVPESVNGPAIIIQPGEPYIDAENATFGTYSVHWLVSVLSEIATNERMTDDLNALIGDVLSALDGWGIDSVSAPFAFQYNSATYLAANVAVTDSVSFKE